MLRGLFAKWLEKNFPGEPMEKAMRRVFVEVVLLALHASLFPLVVVIGDAVGNPLMTKEDQWFLFMFDCFVVPVISFVSVIGRMEMRLRSWQPVINAMQVIPYHRPPLLAAACPLCNKVYSEGDPLLRLPGCWHLIHEKCILHWQFPLQIGASLPVLQNPGPPDTAGDGAADHSSHTQGRGSGSGT